MKVHGGVWYRMYEGEKTMTLYGSSGDYGEPRLAFLNRIPCELKGYTFLYSVGLHFPPNPLDLSGVEWV